MADEETVTLEFIARRLDAIQRDIAQMRDETTVLTGMTQRVEGAVLGLTTEIVGLRSMLLRHEQRLRRLEDDVKVV